MKTACASWDIHCHVECPHCEAYLDLMEILDDYWEVLPPPGERTEDFDEEVECPDCGEKFKVEAIYY